MSFTNVFEFLTQVRSHKNSDVYNVIKTVQMHMQSKSELMSKMAKEEQPLQPGVFRGSLGSKLHPSLPEIPNEEQPLQLDVFRRSLEIGRHQSKSKNTANEHFPQVSIHTFILAIILNDINL